MSISLDDPCCRSSAAPAPGIHEQGDLKGTELAWLIFVYPTYGHAPASLRHRMILSLVASSHRITRGGADELAEIFLGGEAAPPWLVAQAPAKACGAAMCH